MENSKQVFNTIISNLSRSYIFYVPKRYYHYIDPTFLSDIIKPNMVNIVYYSNLQQEVHNNPSAIDGLEILKKENLLNNNVIDLIALKNNVSPEEFKHTMEKYGDYVGIHCILTQWMFKNVKNDIPITPSKTESMFQVQANAFDKHANKLESYFGEETITFEVDGNHILEIVSETLEELPEVDINNEIEIPTKQDKKEEPVKTKQQKSLMTDDKARKYILETVFGIDPEYLCEDV